MTKAIKNSLSFLTAWLTVFMAAPAFAATGGVIGEAVPWEIGFQPAGSPMRERMEAFHNHLLMPIITVIVVLVMSLLLIVIVRFNARANPVPSKTTHNTLLEIVWTLVPVIILVVIAVPSMKMLYYLDRTNHPDMTLKVTGYQWYWGYEYTDNGDVNFLANIVPEKDLKPGEPRLLTTDNPVVLPIDENIKLLITSSDVIHSWSVPALGVKLDAVPGRINQTWVRIDKIGTYYGQCDQLCGANHAFMPIEIHAVSKADFAVWLKAHGDKGPAPVEQEKAAADIKTVGAESQVPAMKAEDAKPAEKAESAKPAEKTENKKSGEKAPAAPSADQKKQ